MVKGPSVTRNAHFATNSLPHIVNEYFICKKKEEPTCAVAFVKVSYGTKIEVRYHLRVYTLVLEISVRLLDIKNVCSFFFFREIKLANFFFQVQFFFRVMANWVPIFTSLQRFNQFCGSNSLQQSSKLAVLCQDFRTILIGKNINDICDKVNYAIISRNVSSADAFTIDCQKSVIEEFLHVRIDSEFGTFN